MKTNKLDRFETKSASEPSPEQINQAKQTFVNLLTPIVEKMLRSPETIRPVKESFAELARQAREGVPRESTLIISGESEKKSSKKLTDIDSGGQENSGKSKFTDLELETLRQIENAKH
jgi:hypothetical protein